MCGIAGLIAQDIRSVPQETIATMRGRILYRGRDDQREWTDGQHVHLLHSRLSIIDLKTGQQPMWDVSGRYVIVFNGEIYNYKELRAEYERQGAQFRTQSDTEVILEGFKLKGANVCKELNGMFALAVWDTQDKQLFLARDHLGKKPLYWCSLGGVFYFASTLDAFHAIPGWDGKLATGAIRLYSSFGGFPEDLTVYENAHAVPYASYCFVRLGEPAPYGERYWRMDFSRKSTHGLDDLLDEYESLLTDAVAIRLRSDVPLAITFSGGVDSGTIAAICTQKLNTSLVCYTIDYHTPDDPSEETIIAEQTAQHLGLDWQFIQFDYHADLLRDLPAAYQYYDQPSVQLALVYSHRLYQAIKPFATVVLSGNGGDELFTGYNGDEKSREHDLFRERFGWAQPLLRLASAPVLSNLTACLKVPELLARLDPPGVYVEDDNRDLVTLTVWERALRQKVEEERHAGVSAFLDQLMFNSLIYGTTDSNYRLPDISGLATQVEVRSPFLDYRLVEFAARLPHRFKVADPSTPALNKYLPKLYYARKVPADIAWARKKGMGMNLQWGKKIANDPTYLLAFESAYSALDRAGIDSAMYREAWVQYRKGNRQYAGTMMAGFMLQAWLARQLPVY